MREISVDVAGVDAKGLMIENEVGTLHKKMTEQAAD